MKYSIKYNELSAEEFILLWETERRSESLKNFVEYRL